MRKALIYDEWIKQEEAMIKTYESKKNKAKLIEEIQSTPSSVKKAVIAKWLSYVKNEFL